MIKIYRNHYKRQSRMT
ncbi:unnamed protein product, partial [Allacma fusca]